MRYAPRGRLPARDAGPPWRAKWTYSWCMRSNWADWGARGLLGDLSGLRKPLAGHYLSSFNGGRQRSNGGGRSSGKKRRQRAQTGEHGRGGGARASRARGGGARASRTRGGGATTSRTRGGGARLAERGAVGPRLAERGARRVPEVSAPAFTGRQEELAALSRALADPPAVVLVEGEAGIGKSRLVREFLDRENGQVQSLVAGCPPFRRPCTLSPLVDAIRHATASPPQPGLSGLAGALRPLFPEWSAELPPAPEPAEDATASRHRLFRALGELLASLQVKRARRRGRAVGGRGHPGVSAVPRRRAPGAAQPGADLPARGRARRLAAAAPLVPDAGRHGRAAAGPAAIGCCRDAPAGLLDARRRAGIGRLRRVPARAHRRHPAGRGGDGTAHARPRRPGAPQRQLGASEPRRDHGPGDDQGRRAGTRPAAERGRPGNPGRSRRACRPGGRAVAACRGRADGRAARPGPGRGAALRAAGRGGPGHGVVPAHPCRQGRVRGDHRAGTPGPARPGRPGA